jgi:RNA polymerase sigma-70 factor, ECF subfamily
VGPDEQLMLEVRGGSQEAFERLFDAHRPDIYRFFRRRVSEPARAEELAHDVFVVVLQNAPRYEPRSPFRSYLFGIAYNLLMNERRKQRPAGADTAVEDVSSGHADPDAALWVRQALATLEPEAREMVMLREYEQLSYQDIADLLKIPLNTVRTRLFRARMNLKSALTATAPVQVTHDNH